MERGGTKTKKKKTALSVLQSADIKLLFTASLLALAPHSAKPLHRNFYYRGRLWNTSSTASHLSFTFCIRENKASANFCRAEN